MATRRRGAGKRAATGRGGSLGGVAVAGAAREGAAGGEVEGGGGGGLEASQAPSESPHNTNRSALFAMAEEPSTGRADPRS